MTYKVGIDVGGTFTDFLLMDEKGTPGVFKVLSTPGDPSVAVLQGLEAMAGSLSCTLERFLREVEIIVHGTTVTTNAVITGNTARTALLTTKGFRDALQMRRGVREELYNNRYLPPPPVVPRFLRIPVDERVDHTGRVLRKMSREDVLQGIELCRSHGVEAVAVCFMHAYAEDEHEQRTGDLVREHFPDAYLSISSDILPQVRFYDRVSTTVLNSAVGPILKRYLSRLTEGLRKKGFQGVLLIMQSNGGVTTPEAVTRLAASTLLSGPAAAPVAGVAYAGPHGHRSFITVDMGGTSFDAALIKDGKPMVTTDGKVNRYALALPMMEINTIGAGGGSVARIDEGGLLKMGPQSAGAHPGPVCYGLGGADPTCSDANLVLGYLSEDYFAGGKMRLDRTAAERAIQEQVARPLGLDLVEAAHGMYHIMNVNMASAIREISVQRGYDPRDFLLVCAGGAGPVHAALIAAELEIREILIPKESSIFCAAGMLLSDLKHDFVRSYHTGFSEETVDRERFVAMVEELDREGAAVLSGEGITPERRMFRFSLDLRYLGQYHEVNVAVGGEELRSLKDARIRERFHREHNRLYGYDLAREGTGVELVNLRMSAVGLTEKPQFREEPSRGQDPSSCLKGERPVFLPDEAGYADIPVYDGNRMGHGHRLDGPAIVEQVNTTIFVPPGWAISCDPFGSYVLSARGT